MRYLHNYCLFIVYLTNVFIEGYTVNLSELCDMTITMRFTNKTEYDSFPIVTKNLLSSNFVNISVSKIVLCNVIKS